MRKLLVGALCSALLLTACSAEKDDWRAAQAADTSLAYSHFVTQHPDSSHVADARTRAAALVATEAAAMTLGDTPASAVVSPAPLDSAAQAPPPPVAPAPVVAAVPPAAPLPVAAAPVAPTAKPAPAVTKPVAAKGSGYGVQIGAFSSQAKAEAQWQAIEKRFRRELAGSSHQIAAGKAGSKAVFRLKVAQPSQSAAKALCSRLAASGQSCVVYHP